MNHAAPATGPSQLSLFDEPAPAVAAAPALSPPLAVEVSSAKVPGPGKAKKSRIAAQKAP